MDFQPRRCSLADNAVSADVHYGCAADRRFAFVSVRLQFDPTGNAVEAKGLVFVADRNGPFRLFGETELIGENVSDVAFEAQRITYATAYLRSGDSRSQPTGRRRYEISLGANGIGPAAIQRGFRQDRLRSIAAARRRCARARQTALRGGGRLCGDIRQAFRREPHAVARSRQARP